MQGRCNWRNAPHVAVVPWCCWGTPLTVRMRQVFHKLIFDSVKSLLDRALAAAGKHLQVLPSCLMLLPSVPAMRAFFALACWALGSVLGCRKLSRRGLDLMVASEGLCERRRGYRRLSRAIVILVPSLSLLPLLLGLLPSLAALLLFLC